MSRWTHAICPKCYEEQEPGRKPAALVHAEPKVCCFCNRDTDEGIYYRADPDKPLCGGKHKE